MRRTPSQQSGAPDESLSACFPSDASPHVELRQLFCVWKLGVVGRSEKRRCNLEQSKRGVGGLLVLCDANEWPLSCCIFVLQTCSWWVSACSSGARAERFARPKPAKAG